MKTYKEDFYAWTINQANFLKQRQFEQIDAPNLIKEIESLGISEKKEFISRLAVLLAHLLKWEFQPEKQSHSWVCTIREQRKRVKKLLTDNPSFKRDLIDSINSAYQIAIETASAETKIKQSLFPSNCIYTFEEIVDLEFYPEENE